MASTLLIGETADVEPPRDDPDPADAALVARAQADRRAFAPLYQRYVDPTYRYCFRRLGSNEAAEDATSRVFAQALAALPCYVDRGPGTFRSWLFAIAHNIVVNHRRSARQTWPIEDAAAIADSAAGPEALALAAIERATLARTLARLPEGQRQLLELRLAGLATTEIASVLGRSPGAIRVAQFRALARLRLLLGDERRDGTGETTDQPGGRS